MEQEKAAVVISDTERAALIARLVEELPVLRTKLRLSQSDIATIIGVSRQTYSSIESKRRKMTWSIFLSLILVFDSNEATHEHIRRMDLFPPQILTGAESDKSEDYLTSFLQIDNIDLKNCLDEQAIHAIEALVMVEYARCRKMTGEAVVKAFDGKRLVLTTSRDVKAQKALESIRAGNNGKK